MSPPLSAKVLSRGAIELDNLTGQPIPLVLLFERRGDKFGYRIVTSPQDHAILETPSLTGTSDSLHQDLEDLLVSQGLFRDESPRDARNLARFLVRRGQPPLLYCAPLLRGFRPSSLHPAGSRAIRASLRRPHRAGHSGHGGIHRNALATHDRAIPPKYGRFFFPIFQIISQKSDPERHAQLLDDLFAAP